MVFREERSDGRGISSGTGPGHRDPFPIAVSMAELHWGNAPVPITAVPFLLGLRSRRQHGAYPGCGTCETKTRVLAEPPSSGASVTAVLTRDDARGRFLGINTMVTGPEVGMAVPVHVVKEFLRRELGSDG